MGAGDNDNEEDLVEIPLDGCPSELQRAQTLQRISDGVVGLFRGSFAFQSPSWEDSVRMLQNNNLENEITVPPQGLSRRQTQMMKNLFDQLGKEEIIHNNNSDDDDDDDSIASNLSEFVGCGQRIEQFSKPTSMFRHRLALSTPVEGVPDIQQPQQEHQSPVHKEDAAAASDSNPMNEESQYELPDDAFAYRDHHQSLINIYSYQPPLEPPPSQFNAIMTMLTPSTLQANNPYRQEETSNSAKKDESPVLAVFAQLRIPVSTTEHKEGLEVTIVRERSINVPVVDESSSNDESSLVLFKRQFVRLHNMHLPLFWQGSDNA